jgi:deoxyribose-phosphate aldolase
MENQEFGNKKMLRGIVQAAAADFVKRVTGIIPLTASVSDRD